MYRIQTLRPIIRTRHWRPAALIVVCGDVSRVISASDLYEYSYNSYYQATQSGFDGEGQITSAIAYVTSDDIPKLYVLEGHGEWELSSDLTDQIEKENIEVESLSLFSQSAVPEDAAAIMINSPSTDLSAEAAQMILTYLQNGGKAFITSTYTEEDMPQFQIHSGILRRINENGRCGGRRFFLLLSAERAVSAAGNREHESHHISDRRKQIRDHAHQPGNRYP